MSSKRKNKPPHPFGAVVVRLRQERGLSAYRLAKMIGKTPDQMRVIERGDSEPRAATIVVIAQALNMEPWDLFKEMILAMREAESKAPS